MDTPEPLADEELAQIEELVEATTLAHGTPGNSTTTWRWR